jgi:regulator of RNase E activity RraA
VITDGTVRDLDEVRALGFPFFASGASVSVLIGGLDVHPGDLIVADKHGAILIPEGAERQVIAALRDVEQYERPMIDLCRSAEF